MKTFFYQIVIDDLLKHMYHNFHIFSGKRTIAVNWKTRSGEFRIEFRHSSLNHYMPQKCSVSPLIIFRIPLKSNVISNFRQIYLFRQSLLDLWPGQVFEGLVIFWNQIFTKRNSFILESFVYFHENTSVFTKKSYYVFWQ